MSSQENRNPTTSLLFPSFPFPPSAFTKPIPTRLQHSHLGVDAQPSLSATDDTNSRAGPIQPQLRTIDTINAHDLAYKRTVAGGVTTTLVLPGSANNIGGEWSSRFGTFFFLPAAGRFLSRYPPRLVRARFNVYLHPLTPRISPAQAKPS